MLYCLSQSWDSAKTHFCFASCSRIASPYRRETDGLGSPTRLDQGKELLSICYFSVNISVTTLLYPNSIGCLPIGAAETRVLFFQCSSRASFILPLLQTSTPTELSEHPPLSNCFLQFQALSLFLQSYGWQFLELTSAIC